MNADGRGSENIRGIDIGTGSSCIYGLIGTKKYDWRMICSDINNESITNASKIIEENKLGEVLKIKKQENSKFIFKGILDSLKYDFSMCNPPFFASDTEREDRRSTLQIKSKECEDVTEGGEVGFLTRMI